MTPEEKERHDLATALWDYRQAGIHTEAAMTPEEIRPTVKELPSGYLHVRWSAECWAQFPKGYSRDIIEDRFIFAAETNRDRVNAWWRTR